MQRKAEYILIALLAPSVLGIGLCLVRLGGAGNLGWERGPLTVAERDYHVARIEAVVNAWGNMECQANTDSSGRIVDDLFARLVVDTDHRWIWIRRDGQR